MVSKQDLLYLSRDSFENFSELFTIMSILLNLPSALCHVILSEWLLWGDLCKTDLASSNTVHKKQLLDQFQLFPPVEIDRSVWPFALFEWIYARKISLKVLCIDYQCFDAAGKPKPIFYFDKLREVFLEVCSKISDTHLADFVNLCVGLKSLTAEKKVLQFVNVNILSQLESLSVQSSPFFSVDKSTLTSILGTSNLRTLNCFVATSSVDVDLFCDVISANEQLQNICLEASFDSSAILERIVKVCRHCRVIQLIDYSMNAAQYQLSDMLKVHERFPDLSQLTFLQRGFFGGPSYEYVKKGDIVSLVLSRYTGGLQPLLSPVISSVLKSFEVKNCKIELDDFARFIGQSIALEKVVFDSKDDFLWPVKTFVDLFNVLNGLNSIRLPSKSDEADYVDIVRSRTPLIERQVKNFTSMEDLDLDTDELFRNIHGVLIRIRLTIDGDASFDDGEGNVIDEY